MADAMRHHVRYNMRWGHELSAKGERVEVTRAEYNESFGVDSPEAPEIPDEVLHVWEWWWHLNSRRPPGFESPPPLTYSEIYHWSTLTRTQVTIAEVQMLFQVDDAFIEAVNKERKAKRERDKN